MSLADSNVETGGAPQAAQLAVQSAPEGGAQGPSAGPPQAGPRGAQRTAAMPFILVAVLIDMISIGLMVPVLPHIVGQFTHSNDEQTLAFLAVTLTFGIANFVSSPILGALSDRFGRRPVLLLGFAGLALSFFVTAAATALWMLVAVRMFSGAMQSNISIANAYVADISAPQDRARRFGLLGAMFGVGFILGPVIGGVLGDIDVRLPFVVAGGMALLNWCYGFFVLPESLPKERRRAFAWRRANPVAALKGLAALKGVGALVWVIGMASLAQFMLHMSWVLYTKFKFGWGPGQVGWSLFAVGLVSAFSQGVLLKQLLRRFTPQQLAVIGLARRRRHLPRLRPGHRGLDGLRGDQLRPARWRCASGHAKHCLQRRRSHAARPDHGRGGIAEQPDGGGGAGGGARAAALGVASAGGRLADRTAVLRLLRAAIDRSNRRLAFLPNPQEGARTARADASVPPAPVLRQPCRTTRSSSSTSALRSRN